MAAEGSVQPTALRWPGIPADPTRASRAREAFHTWIIELFALDPDRSSAFTLAVNEAIANAVEHAYKDETSSGTVDLTATYNPIVQELTVMVADHGSWRDPLPDPLRLRGRGIPLIEGLADAVSIERRANGTTVVLSWAGVLPRH